MKEKLINAITTHQNLTNKKELIKEIEDLYMIEFLDEYSLTKDKLKEITKHFDYLNVEGTIHDLKESELRVFPSFKDMFYWVYEDSDTETLIYHMFNKDYDISEKQYIIFEDGTTVYQYQ